jgi:alpha-tubulin suppressor-like RCC1 family protein
MTTFTAAIDRAATALEEGVHDKALEAEITDDAAMLLEIEAINTAINYFYDAMNPGTATALVTKALSDTIADARWYTADENVDKLSVSVNGAELSYGKYWINAEMNKLFSDEIDAAKKVLDNAKKTPPEATQSAVDNARGSLLSMMNVVNKVKAHGALTTVAQIFAGEMSSFIITTDGYFMATGVNLGGELGMSNSLGRYSFTPVPDIDGEVIVTAAAGSQSSFVVIQGEGAATRVLAAGVNNSYLLGLGDDNETKQMFTQVTGLDGVTIVDIAVGQSHTLALDKDGNVWGAGFNSHGQLGDIVKDDATDYVKTFKQITGAIADKQIDAIAAGEQHSLVLIDGKVWGAGDNYYGQLGLDTESSSSVFKQITGGIAAKTIVAIAAGERHSLALDSEGYLWGAGLNDDGQLGDAAKDDGNLVKTFKQIGGIRVNMSKDYAIAAGTTHSVVLTDGEVWITGNNEAGQLGLSDTDNTNKDSFEKVPGITGVSAIAAKSAHTLLLIDGSMFAAGLGACFGSDDSWTFKQVPILYTE